MDSQLGQGERSLKTYFPKRVRFSSTCIKVSTLTFQSILASSKSVLEFLLCPSIIGNAMSQSTGALTALDIVSERRAAVFVMEW